MHGTQLHRLAVTRQAEDRAVADRQRRIRQAGSLHSAHESIEAARAAIAAWFSPFRTNGLSPA
jgi:hypothetical protein